MYTLLTGATGLVGRYLVRDLLLNGHNLAVVVRGSRKMSAYDRMEQIMQHWEAELGRQLPRPVVIVGDISQAGFDFSEEDRDWVKDNVNTIIHSAAILEFYGEDREGEPWRTNLGGTRNMIQLCRDLQITDIHYVSTAYVAGIQDEPVMEDSLDSGQSFRNDYEESKFLAEKEVREIDFAEHVTVYRPAVISGDSITGYTNTYHGIYLYLRLMALIIPAQPADENGIRHTPVRLKMTGDETRNIIPVDWISAVTVRLFETQEARGGTYHMAPDNPMTSGNMVRWCSEYYKSTGTTFCGHDFDPVEDRSVDEDQYMFEQMLRDNMGTYEPYERTDNVFDMTQMKKFAGDIVCPDIDRTIMHRYLDYGNDDKWGKRKIPHPQVDTNVADMLETDRNAGETVSVGLDVSGPGGGSFTLHLGAAGLGGVDRGLRADNAATVRLTTEELVQALEQPESDASLLAKYVDVEDTDLRNDIATRILAGVGQASEVGAQ